ncbi:MAG: chromate transporter [Christensenellaceae bacterium]|nr:chromate transporter [Christensenellaceae bacterium]
MKKLWELFILFARIGGLTFGGGYAMLPMLQKEIVENKGWATEEELMDYYAIGQCTPGIIAVNTATFIGYKTAGVFGGIFATLGVIAPSIVIISIIAAFISNFADLQVVSWAFTGIRVCVCVLIFNSVLKLGKGAIKDWPALLVFLAVFVLSLLTEISTILFVVCSGLLGFVIRAISRKCKGKESEGSK